MNRGMMHLLLMWGLLILLGGAEFAASYLPLERSWRPLVMIPGVSMILGSDWLYGGQEGIRPGPRFRSGGHVLVVRSLRQGRFCTTAQAERLARTPANRQGWCG